MFDREYQKHPSTTKIAPVAVDLLRSCESASPSAQVEAATQVPQVPIDKIFKIEFSTFGISPEERARRRDEYEQYVTGLMNCVALGSLYCVMAVADKQALSKAVNMKDERVLFEYLIEVFHKDFNASYVEDRPLTLAIENNEFNCYSSTVLLADCISRLGKEVTIVLTPGHIFFKGHTYALETTASDSKKAVLDASGLAYRYPNKQEGGLELLLATAYNTAGLQLDKIGRHEEELECYDMAIGINPKYAEAWYNKGFVLSELGRHEEALKCYDAAIGINPKNAAARNNKGKELFELGRTEEALKWLGFWQLE